MPVLKVYLATDGFLEIHKYATPKRDVVITTFAPTDEEAKANRIYPDKTYKVSDKPFADARELKLCPKKEDCVFHYYRQGRRQSTLAFCKQRLTRFFGEVPAFIYFKEVGEGNKL